MKPLAFTDQMNRRVLIPQEPQRIVSLVPSITELLFSLGLGDRVVGVTRFCIFPEEARKNSRNIGGTKKLHIDRIAELQPDLIIGSKEENTRDEIDALAKHHPVWMSDVQTVSQGIDMIRQVGEITGTTAEANRMANKISSGFKDLKTEQREPAFRVAYLIWYDPIMVSGGDNFISNVLETAGWQNIFSQHMESRYPEVSIPDLKAAKPEVIFLSSEPYPFKQKHVDLFTEALPDSRVILVDGAMFSWYGSRMLQMPAYLSKLADELKS